MSFENGDQDQKGQQGETEENVQQQQGGDQPFLVHEGRVYQTKEDLIKKLANADQHIQTLEQEAAERQKQQEAVEKQKQSDMLAEVLQAVKQNGRKDDQTDHASKPELNEDAIAEKAVQKVLDSLSAKEQGDNMGACMEAAKAHYGENYVAKVQEKAKELGIDSIDNLAKSSPAAFKKLFIPEAAQGSSSFSSGSSYSDDGQGDTRMDDEGESASIAYMPSNKAGEKIISLGEKYGLYKEADEIAAKGLKR